MTAERMKLREILAYLSGLADDSDLIDQEGTLIIHCEDGDIIPHLSKKITEEKT